MKRILILVIITSGLLSCSKKRIEPSFYELERSIFLEDYFANDSNWVRNITSEVNGDSAFAYLDNGDLVLYSYGYAHSYVSLDFNDWESDIICFEIGFKSFNGRYLPYDDYIVTSVLCINFDNNLIYRDKWIGELDVISSAIHIKIDRSTNSFKVYNNDENVSELFSFRADYGTCSRNSLLVGSRSDGYPMKRECETIIDYIILYTID